LVRVCRWWSVRSSELTSREPIITCVSPPQRVTIVRCPLSPPSPRFHLDSLLFCCLLALTWSGKHIRLSKNTQTTFQTEHQTLRKHRHTACPRTQTNQISSLETRDLSESGYHTKYQHAVHTQRCSRYIHLGLLTQARGAKVTLSESASQVKVGDHLKPKHQGLTSYHWIEQSINGGRLLPPDDFQIPPKNTSKSRTFKRTEFSEADDLIILKAVARRMEMGASTMGVNMYKDISDKVDILR
jgi:hypothetical protein